jgi:hypothetical protein
LVKLLTGAPAQEVRSSCPGETGVQELLTRKPGVPAQTVQELLVRSSGDQERLSGDFRRLQEEIRRHF